MPAKTRNENSRGLKGYLFDAALVLAAYAAGVFIRAQSALNYGAKLTSDDPLLHYMITKYLIEHGHLPHYWPLGWHPWSYDPARVLPILHYYLGALIYRLAALVKPDASLLEVVVYTPAFFAPLMVIPVYFTAKLLWNGRRVPAFAAAMLASVSYPAVMRTIAGFYRHEQFALPFLAASFYFTLRAVREEDEAKSLLFAGLSGLMLVCAAGLWAGFRALYDGYPLFLLGLMAFEWADLRDYLALALPSGYVILSSIALYPHLNQRRVYIGMETTLVYGAILAGAVYLLWPRLRSDLAKKVDRRIAALATFGAVIGVLFALGVYKPLTARLARVVFPWIELPKGSVVETVAEHRPGAIGQSMKIILLPALLGLALMFLERRRDKDHLLVIYFTALTLYFSYSIVRLPPLASPFVALSAAYLTNRAWDAWESRAKRFTVGRRGKAKRISLSRKVKILALPIAMIVLFTVLPLAGTAYRSYQLAAHYRLGFTQGWDDALSYMKENAEWQTAISWWDYGYWLAYGSDVATLADGLTINSTQIRLIARGFMGSEEDLLDLAMRFNASYVVIDLLGEVYDPYTGQFLSPHGGKWLAIGWIAGEFEYSPYTEPYKFGEYDIPRLFRYVQEANRYFPTDYALQKSLFKLSLHAISEFQNQTYGPAPEMFELVHIGGRSIGIPNVAIYRVRGIGGP